MLGFVWLEKLNDGNKRNKIAKVKYELVGIKICKRHDCKDLLTKEFIKYMLLLLLLLSRFSHVRIYSTPSMAAHQVPLSLGFSRPEHWSGLLFPSQENIWIHIILVWFLEIQDLFRVIETLYDSENSRENVWCTLLLLF